MIGAVSEGRVTSGFMCLIIRPLGQVKNLIKMKKIAYIAVVALAVVACNKEEGGAKIDSLKVVPETKTLYTDEALPELAVVLDPEDADVTVEWESSDPEIVTVSDKGELAFAVKDIEDAEKTVTITAKAGDKTATCVLTVKGQISRYEIVDLTADCGFKMLDRNVGAKTKEEVGNFYQWGKVVPVASNNDTKANESYDANWSTASEGFVDWTVAENTPCPKGWELPTEGQIQKLKYIFGEILTYEEYPDYYEGTEEEYQTYKKIQTSLNLLNSGKFTAADKDDKFKGESFWSSTLKEKDGKELPGIYWNGAAPTFEIDTYNVAVPVRCVKSTVAPIE